MGSIVSVKQRARKKTTAITAFGSNLFVKQHAQTTGGNSQQKIGNINGKVHAWSEHDPKARYVSRNLDEESERNSSVNENKTELGKENLSEGANEKELTWGSDSQIDKEKHLDKVGFDTKEILKLRDDAKEGIEENAAEKVEGDKVDLNEQSSHVNGPQESIPNIDLDDRGNVSEGEDLRPYYSLSSTPDSLCQGKPLSGGKPRSPRASPVHQAFSSWGEGVIGVSSAPRSPKGYVTSRGLDVAVKSSAGSYDDFAVVRSYKSPIPETFSVKSHKGECKCSKCIDARMREKAAVRIQRHMRGYQVRKEMLVKRKSIVKIQRIYRARVQKRISEGLLDCPSISKPRERSGTATPNNQEMEIGEATKECFELYQDDIVELKWKSQQLIETANMGEEYEPQKVLLISSNMQRPEWLARVSLQNVHVIMYQFAEVTLKDILENIGLSLDDYRVGSKAKRIAFVCQGGPGYLYICRGKALTSNKLEKEKDLRDFLRQLGGFISKKDPSDTKVHFIGSNVLGNKHGVDLLENIKRYMHPARVSVESPFEISESGVEMLKEYFNVELYNVWKKSRFTKMWMPEI